MKRMPENRAKQWILLCGLLVFTATPRCHAQEPVKLFDVKVPQAEVAPAVVPEVTKNPTPEAVEAKPAREATEQSWYWRLLEGIAIGAAKNNTEKQDDGRPQPRGTTW